MAYRYIYATYRKLKIGSFNLGDQSLNGGYTCEFFNSGTFKEYSDANIVKLDEPIPEDKFTGVLPLLDNNEQVIGTTPKYTRFVRLKYSDQFTTEVDLTNSIEKSGAINSVKVFATLEDCKQWIRDNTSLTELSPGLFEISAETNNPITNEVVPQKTLEII